MSILKLVLILLEVVLLFNLLIFVHELGHFLAARWRGLKIDRFAIWFGKPIWKKKINGVEYALGTIPAGGYVSLPQMATMEAIEGKSESSDQPLPPISALDKIIVAFAGPLFSFLLAVGFAFIVWAVGRPEPNLPDSTTIGWVDPAGPAAKAGLRPGDKILEIDDHPVKAYAATTQDSVTWRIITSEGSNIKIKYLRDGCEGLAYPVPTKLPTKWYERKSLRKIILLPAEQAIIAKVATNSPAAMANLRENDEVIAFNGQKVFSPETIMYAEAKLTNGPLQPATVTIRRGSEQFDCKLVPEIPIKPANASPSFGILAWLINTNEALVHPTPIEQIRVSAGQIVATLQAVMSRKSDVGLQQLGGPVMIARAYKTFLESENGWRRVLWFSVVLNVNLALLNMLPFPVLDGGHITLALFEAIRRRPVSVKVLQALQTPCAGILIGFMLIIMFFDTSDWVRSARNNREEPVEFAPKH